MTTSPQQANLTEFGNRVAASLADRSTSDAAWVLEEANHDDDATVVTASRVDETGTTRIAVEVFADGRLRLWDEDPTEWYLSENPAEVATFTPALNDPAAAVADLIANTDPAQWPCESNFDDPYWTGEMTSAVDVVPDARGGRVSRRASVGRYWCLQRSADACRMRRSRSAAMPAYHATEHAPGQDTVGRGDASRYGLGPS